MSVALAKICILTGSLLTFCSRLMGDDGEDASDEEEGVKDGEEGVENDGDDDLDEVDPIWMYEETVAGGC